MSQQTKEKYPPDKLMIADTNAKIDLGGGHAFKISPGDTAHISKTFVSPQTGVPSVVFVPQGNKSTFVVPLAMVKKHYRAPNGPTEADKLRRDNRNNPNPQVTTGGRRSPEEIRARAGKTTGEDMQSTNESYELNEEMITEAYDVVDLLMMLELHQIDDLIDGLNLDEALYLEDAMEIVEMVLLESDERRSWYKSTKPMSNVEYSKFKKPATVVAPKAADTGSAPSGVEAKFDALLNKVKQKETDGALTPLWTPGFQRASDKTVATRSAQYGKSHVSQVTGKISAKTRAKDAVANAKVEAERRAELQRSMGLRAREDMPATSTGWRGNVAHRTLMKDVPIDPETGERKFGSDRGRLTAKQTKDAQQQGKAAADVEQKFGYTKARLQQRLDQVNAPRTPVKRGDAIGRRMSIQSRWAQRKANRRDFGTGVRSKVREKIGGMLADMGKKETQEKRAAVGKVRDQQTSPQELEFDKLFADAKKANADAKSKKKQGTSKAESIEYVDQGEFMIENYVNYASEGDVVNFADTIRDRLNVIAHEAIEMEKAIQLGYDAVEDEAQAEGIEEATNDLVEHINSMDDDQLNEYFDSLSDEEMDIVEQLLDEAKYGTKKGRHRLAMKIRAGKDVGKKGKNFEKIADKAAKAYGSVETGKKVAAAAMWKRLGK